MPGRVHQGRHADEPGCQHITASPGKIGDIARAALVLTHFERGYLT
jgi:hypothetical protein